MLNWLIMDHAKEFIISIHIPNIYLLDGIEHHNAL